MHLAATGHDGSSLSSVVRTARGSDLDDFFKPSTSSGNYLPSFTFTVTFTPGDTLYFMPAMLCASTIVVKVPDYNQYWSPTSATVLPHGTSAICFVVRPIISAERWMFIALRSPFAAMLVVRALDVHLPGAMVPLKTRPKA